MKRQLYHEDAYCFKFNAQMVSKEEVSGKFHIRLDRSFFYPESGGQISDKGSVNGIPVESIAVDDDEDVILILNSLPEGEEASCEISSSDRLRNMRFHTVQHIISGVAKKEYGAETRGFHMSEKYSTVDLCCEGLDSDKIGSIEENVNGILLEDRAVRTFWITDDDAKEMELRSKKVKAEALRVVEIDGVDSTLCAGTHISSTGQAGLCRITGVEKIRGLYRLFFVCGMEAARYMSSTGMVVDSLKNIFSVPADDLEAAAEKAVKEAKACQKEIRVLKKEAAEERAERTFDSGKTNYLFEEEIVPLEFANVFASRLMEKGAKRCLLYYPETADAVIYTSRREEAEQAGRMIMAKTGCRGGGKNGFFRLNNVDKEPMFTIIREEFPWC